MGEIKTKQTDADVSEFIRSFANNEQKVNDGYELLQLIKMWTGFEPKMWGPSIIGFGVYHYKSDRSKQEGDWPIVGFSPRKAAISLYVYSGDPSKAHLLEQLGKYKMGKACIYVKKLSDIDLNTLKKLVDSSVEFVKRKYGN